MSYKQRVKEMSAEAAYSTGVTVNANRADARIYINHYTHTQ